MNDDIQGTTRELAELRRLVRAQAEELDTLRHRLDDVERAGGAAHPPRPEPDEGARGGDGTMPRRRLLALAGAAAAAIAGATAATSTSAAAANGEPMVVGTTTTASAGAAATTTLDYSPVTSGQGDYLRVTDSVDSYSSDTTAAVVGNDLSAAIAGFVTSGGPDTSTGVVGVSQVPNGKGVIGVASGGGSSTGTYGVWGASTTGRGVYGSSQSGTAVHGSSNSGAGVVGTSQSGYAVFVGGNGRLGLASHMPVGPPTSGTYPARTIIGDDNGDLWLCVASGSPGTWRLLSPAPAADPEPVPPPAPPPPPAAAPPAAPAVTGLYRPLAPTRVYDSRVSQPAPGLLIPPASRTISVADGRDPSGAVAVPNLVPVGALAITCNVTVVNTQPPGGFLTLNPGGVTSAAAATINWFGPNQILNNGVTVAIDGNRQLTVVAGGSSTDFVLDVTGYFI